MGRSWLKHPGASLPVVFPGKAERKAAYRLLSSNKVTMEHILESHQAATAERCALEKVVLAIHDTTAINYNGLEATRGLVGSVSGKGVKGLMAHFGLAVNLVGRPLGVFSLDADFRHEAQQDEKESRRWLEGLERAGELAAACRETRVITVCDREGDIWKMFREAATTGAGLLVRANRARSRRVISANGSLEDLWDHVAGQPSLASKTITIEACGGPRSREERKAKLDLRACTGTLAAPTDATDKTATRMLAVSATETSPPHDKEPLHWLLLTTEGEPSAEQARKVIAFYERRWSIETWFSVLKTGTRAGDPGRRGRRAGHDRLSIRIPPHPRRPARPGAARSPVRYPHLRRRSCQNSRLRPHQTTTPAGNPETLGSMDALQSSSHPLSGTETKQAVEMNTEIASKIL